MQKLSLVFNKYYYILLVFLAVFIPLYPKFPLFNVAGTYVAVRAEDLFIAVAFLIWVLIKRSKLRSYLKENIYAALILFWLIGGLSLLSALLITQSVSFHLGFLHWLRRVEYMALFIMAATSLTSLRQVKLLTLASVLTSIIVVLYGFGQITLNFPVISTTNSEFSKGLILFLTNGARVNSTFAGHYDLAIYISLILVLLASQFFYYRKLIPRALLALVGFMNFILLGFTASRISFAAALVGLVGVFWLAKKRLLVIALLLVALSTVALVPDLRHRLVATVTVNLLGGGGPKYAPPPNTVTVFTPKKNLPQNGLTPIPLSSATESGAVARDTVPGEPINTTELGVYRSFGIRLNVEWPRAWGAFTKNPFLGTGYSSLTIATDNDILRSLGETGLLGTGALGLILFILVRKMLMFIKAQEKEKFEQYFIIASLCSIAVVLVTTLFIDVLEASKVAEFFWLVMGSAWAVVTRYSGKINNQE